MTVSEIRRKYLEFFRERGHAIVPSAKLVPENDPTTLFTGSGMQPMLPYFLGEPHPQGTRVADSQKSFRAQDIEEVGDNRHTTFFEMLGNWSFGDYFKEEQLRWFFEFLTDKENGVGLDPARLYVSVYDGDPAIGVPRDDESIAIWKKLFKEKGIEAKFVSIGTEERGYEVGMQGGRIFGYTDKNWWSRVGSPEKMPAGEPGGPDSEVFYDFGSECATHPLYKDKQPHPNSDSGQFMEIGNSVFMQYLKQEDGSFGPLPKQNVDFGGGLERIAAAVNGVADVFLIDAMQVLIRELSAASGKNYNDPLYQKSFRIITDHLRGAVFMIGDGVVPSNTEQGYILRRLIRRSVQHMDKLGIPEGNTIATIATRVIDSYTDQYPELPAMREHIKATLTGEEEKFRKTLSSGMKEFEKMLQNHGAINGEDAFVLFTTYGFPIELTEELALERGFAIDRRGFEEKMEEHKAQSRSGAEHKFKGGLADSGEVTTMLHTCTHLMLAGLRKFLGDHVHQAGSNITAERTRFDFTHPEKVPREILDTVEAYVNEAIQKKCDMVIEQMPKAEAQGKGVEGSFWEKYPDIVNVYMVKCADETVYSQELCGGPHVHNTGDIRGTFKILKEEASSAGVRRVKAVLEK